MLSLKSLKDHNSDILKAEIGALLFNMGKTCVEFWKKYFPDIKGSFSDYENYTDYYEKGYFFKELNAISPALKNFSQTLK